MNSTVHLSKPENQEFGGFPLIPYASKVRSNTKGLPLLPVLPLDEEACLCLQHLRTERKITDSSYDCNLFFLRMSTLFSYRSGHTGKSDIAFRQRFSETLHTALSDWIALTLVLLLLVPVGKKTMSDFMEERLLTYHLLSGYVSRNLWRHKK